MNTHGMIEKYLDGKMDAKERKNFEEKMKHDQELRSALMMHAEVNESIVDEDKEALRKKIGRIVQSPSAKGSMSHHRRPLTVKLVLSRTVLVAASVLFIFSIGSIMFILNTTKYTPNEVFEYYYQPYIPDVVTRSSDENLTLTPALEAYMDGEYSAATEGFDDILRTNPDDSMALFYLGIAYIETSEYQKAIDQFRYILKNEFYPYFYHAQWYLGLTYLKLEETEKAVEQFATIVESNKYYSQKAQDVLNKLN